MAKPQCTQTRPEFIRNQHIAHAEEAATQIVHAKAIITLIAASELSGATVENALEAVSEMLERAEAELAEVCHA